MKIRPSYQDGKLVRYFFWCFGCDCYHAFTVAPDPSAPGGPVWSFNGDVENPTFSPSLLCNANTPAKDLYPNTTAHRCHLFLRNGQLQYLGDCTHHLKNTTVPVRAEPDE